MIGSLKQVTTHIFGYISKLVSQVSGYLLPQSHDVVNSQMMSCGHTTVAMWLVNTTKEDIAILAMYVLIHGQVI